MKKFFSVLLIFLLISSCQKQNSEKNSFKSLIQNYHYDENKLNEYEQIYNETSNLIYALNKVNYPHFLTPNSITNNAITKNNILFVNTNYYLSNIFIPDNLVIVDHVDYIKRNNYTLTIDKTTLEAYTKLYNEGIKQGINLTIFSAYRSYEYQTTLYQNSTNGFVAKPGTSEHQTGLAIDIATRSSGLTSHFNLTKEANFLKQNAYKYGFILRYPQDKEHITGYPYESWHYRYVGIDVASIIYHQNLTLEEYFYHYVVL